MSKYFTDFNIVDYKLPADVSPRRVTNILNRYQPIRGVLDRVNLFYDYTVKYGETPEIVSDKFYGVMDHHDIIMLFNKRLSPYFHWVMEDDTFFEFIEQKYGSEQNAKQTVKYYYHVLNPKRVINGVTYPEMKNIITQEIYNNLDAPERSLEYAFDYEHRLNEQMRFIKIVDAIYIPQILAEKSKIFEGQVV